MSSGPSALGTLLVQRLDAMLGTTLSQQSNLVTGARPDAVSQPGTAARTDALPNDTQRDPREAVDRARSHTEQSNRQTIDRSRLDPKTAELLQARNAPSTAATASAPTRLGFAAQTILALLAGYPESPPLTHNRRPLFPFGPQGQAQGEGRQSQPSAGQAASPGAGGSSSASGSPAAPTGAMPASPPSTGGTPEPGSAPGSSNAQALPSGTPGASGASGASTGPSGQTAGSPSGAAGGAPALSTPAPGSATSATGAGAGTTAAAALSGQVAGQVAGQLAQALSAAIQNSGMFYEAHLAQLAFGKMAPSQLRQEPQAQLGGQTASPALRPGAPNTASAGPLPGAPVQAASPGAPAGAPPAAPSAATAAGAGASTLASGLNAMDPKTHLLVRQQLDVLANQQVAWRGEVWPDAPTEWQIERREAWQDMNGDEHPAHWATTLTVDLPELGQVQARITLTDQQVVMRLIAPDSAPVLAQQLDALRSRYSAQGLVLSQLSVSRHDAAPEPVVPVQDTRAEGPAASPLADLIDDDYWDKYDAAGGTGARGPL